MLMQIKNLVKDYKISKGVTFRALNKVNLTFKNGELVSILGESGSGKSTLMNIIGGLDSDFLGEVVVSGKELRHLSDKELDKYRKNKVGFIFQSFNLIPHLTVLDNVAIALTLSNVNRREKQLKATKMLKKVGLKEHMNKRPNQLSGGQKQRVAIARALMNDPDIILADEPTGALDSKTSEQILKIIQEIASEGKLIIMVTHSEKVAKISSRVIRIADGKIISDVENKKVKINTQMKDTTILKQNLPFISAVKLAFNNMRQKLGRNILVALGSSIGITSVILMLSLGSGVENYITDQMYANVNPKVVEVNKKSEKVNSDFQQPTDFMQPKPAFNNVEIIKLSKIKHVVRYEPGYMVFNATNEVIFGDKKTQLSLITTASSNFTKTSIKKGNLPKKDEIAVDALIISQLGLTEKDVIGKKLTLKLYLGDQEIQETVTVSGIYDNTTTVNQGITQAIFNYDTVKETFEEHDYQFDPNTIYLIVDDQDNVEYVKDAIVKLGYEGSFLEKMVNIFTDMLNVITWILSAIAGISLFVSAIMILIVLYISVVERTNEIGVLKAIGARRKDIKRIFVSEAFLIGIGGGLLGVISANLLALLINGVTLTKFDIEVVAVSYKYMALGLMVSIIISMVSGVMPAAKAAKLDPIESLRHE